MEYLIGGLVILFVFSAMMSKHAPRQMARGDAAGAANAGCGCGLWLALAAFLLLLALGLAGVQEVNINAHPAAPGIELRR